MLFSSTSGKQQILEWFQLHELELTTIVDLGAGCGTYIQLIKYNNNICTQSNWIGIEIWNKYIEEYNLKLLYDTIIIDDVRNIDYSKLGNISVTIAGDILEHMEKTEAMELVDKIMKYSKYLIISIPIKHLPQSKTTYENPYQEHVKDDWSHEEVLETWNKHIIDFYVKGKKSKMGVYWLSNENIT